MSAPFFAVPVTEGTIVRLADVARVMRFKTEPFTAPLTAAQRAAIPIVVDVLRPIARAAQLADELREHPRVLAEQKALSTPRPPDGWASAGDGGRLYRKASAAYDEIRDRTKPGESIAAFTVEDRANAGLAPFSGRSPRTAREPALPRRERLKAVALWARFTEARCYLDALFAFDAMRELLAEIRKRQEPPESAPKPAAPPSARGFIRAALADGHHHQSVAVRSAAEAAGFTAKQIRVARERMEAAGELARPRRGVWTRPERDRTA